MRRLLCALVLAGLSAGCGHHDAQRGGNEALHPKRVAEVGTRCTMWSSRELHVDAGNFRIRAACGWDGATRRWIEPQLVPTEVRPGWRWTWNRSGHRWHRGATAIGYIWSYHAWRCDGNDCDEHYGELYGVFRSDGRYTLWGPTDSV